MTFAEGVSGIVGLAVRATATALAASQADALAQMTAEVAGFGRWRWNLATGEIHLDGAAAQLMGVTPGPGSTGDLRPVDIEQFATAVHPEDQARLLSALAADPAAPGVRLVRLTRLVRPARLVRLTRPDRPARLDRLNQRGERARPAGDESRSVWCATPVRTAGWRWWP